VIQQSNWTGSVDESSPTGMRGRGGPMSIENSKADLKQKAVHEFRQFVAISLYLAFFFCAVTTYRMLLLDDFHDAYFNYISGLINALVIAKVILIGEYAHLGKKYEHKPLLLSSAYKALLFGLLVFGFHIVEEAVKRLLHGENMAGALHNMHINDLIGRALVTFCTFVPFFAFREVRRVLGEDKLQDLFFYSGAIAKSDFSNGRAKD
jgi:hypothetical protein